MKGKLCSLATAVFILICSPSAHAQVITLFAGTVPFPGINADSIPATTAQLHGPTGIVSDNFGNIYFSDNRVVRKVNSAGFITTVAGNLTSSLQADNVPATSVTLVSPWGLAFDRKGNLYIADGGDLRIRKVDTAGIITTVAGCGSCGSGGGGIATAAEIHSPHALVVDDTGNIYFTASNSIKKVNTAGLLSTFAGQVASGFGGDGGLATGATFNYPWGICRDHIGNIYVADNERIRKIDTAKMVSTVIGGNSVNIGHHGDCGPATAAQLNNPFDVTIDNAGNFYIADYYNYSIRKVNTAGIITTIAGQDTAGYAGDGGSPLLASFSGLAGIALDNLGNMYVTDRDYNTIRKISNYALVQQNCSPSLAVPASNGESNTANIYPNPNYGSFSINLNSPFDEPVHISITNISGERVGQRDITTNKQASITINAPAGVYFLQAVSAHSTWTEKAIITH